MQVGCQVTALLAPRAYRPGFAWQPLATSFTAPSCAHGWPAAAARPAVTPAAEQAPPPQEKRRSRVRRL